MPPAQPTPRRRSRRPLSRPWRGLLLGLAFAGGFAPCEAPATVEEQRARLPPPADCKDPVAGVWKSHSYDQPHADWTIFTLEIHRVEGSETELEGTLSNHTWLGTPEESQPGPCRGLLRYMISMDAKGTVVNGDISFGGVGQWRLDDVPCGNWNMGYNLDNFSGTIDPAIVEFQSVNNDGGRAVNDPTVFRRVACLDGDDPEEEGPRVVVPPPPFYPPQKDTGGCVVR